MSKKSAPPTKAGTVPACYFRAYHGPSRSGICGDDPQMAQVNEKVQLVNEESHGR
jgi:hypothetical protein